jgi:TRAP-type mannitol/chloroaromatic compound transport system permease small subunit
LVCEAPDNKGIAEEALPALLRFVKAVDGLSRLSGLAANWLVLLATLVCALDALLRYGVSSLLFVAQGGGFGSDSVNWLFDIYKENSNSLRDLQLVMFAGMVMLGASWTLKVNEHVRVDLLYTSVGDRTRIWIDLFGTLLFLIPFCILMIVLGWPWFLQSWTGNELSQNAGGLPRWPGKLFVPLGFALILLQGISEAIKCVAALTSGYKREHAYEKPLQ